MLKTPISLMRRSCLFFLFFFLRKAHSIFTVETWLFAAMINIIMSMSPDRGRTVKLEITENANFNAY